MIDKSKLLKVSEEYKTLFHYTTYSGLDGILTSKALWATHYRYLNDAEEITHAKKLIDSILFPKMLRIVNDGIKSDPRLADLAGSFGGPESFTQLESQKLIDALYNTILDDGDGLQGPFIFSFCAETDDFTNKNGLLSQWRGYGRDGGYCIEFDPKELEDLLSLEAKRFYTPLSSFSDVAYGNILSTTPLDFQVNVDKLEKALAGFVDNFGNRESFKTFMSEGLTPFLSLIPRSKHIGFKEEKEVRIIAYPGTESLKAGEPTDVQKSETRKIHYRSCNGTPSPYIIMFEGVKKLPIKRIIVGPHKDKAIRQKALEQRLRETGIVVSSSEIPFIGL